MRIKKILNSAALPSIVLFISFVLLNSFVSPNFMRVSAWVYFLQTVIPIIILSIGQSVVIIGGGIDISVGATVSVVNTIMATTSSFDGPVFKPLLLGLAAAMAIGAFNGLLVSQLRISPLLATFATSFVGSGLALTILPIPGGQVPKILSDIYYLKIFGIIPLALIYVILVFLIWFFWKRSLFGVSLYATGHNPFKAFFSSINVNKVKFMTFLFSGFAAGIAGLCVSSNFCAGDPRIGNAMTLNSVAACVIGGISLAGGAGSPAGAIFGGLFLYLVLITVMGLGIPPYFQDLISGSIVVIGIMLAVSLQRKGNINKPY